VKPTQTEARRSITKTFFWFPIVISIASLLFSSLQWWDNHRFTIAQATPRVSFETSEDTDDPLVGIKIENAGPAVARLKDLTYYVDKKPMDDIDEAIDIGKLEDVHTFEFNPDDTLAVGETRWLLSKSTKSSHKGDNKSVQQLIDFLDKNLAVQAEVCSLISGECWTVCSTEGWCK
jgi:hypothetical protein